VLLLSSQCRNKQGTISDPVIIHTLFDVSRSLHDFLDRFVPCSQTNVLILLILLLLYSLSFEDDRRQISNLIIAFIRKVRRLIDPLHPLIALYLRVD
jgi:hypothetical protein